MVAWKTGMATEGDEEGRGEDEEMKDAIDVLICLCEGSLEPAVRQQYRRGRRLAVSASARTTLPASDHAGRILKGSLQITLRYTKL